MNTWLSLKLGGLPHAAARVALVFSPCMQARAQDVIGSQSHIVSMHVSLSLMLLICGLV